MLEKHYKDTRTTCPVSSSDFRLERMRGHNLTAHVVQLKEFAEG